MMKTRHQLLSLLACTISATVALAQVPEAISYQGRVTVAGTNFTGLGQFKFALVSADTNVLDTYWSNDGSSNTGSEPTTAVPVPVAGGLFTVFLGDTNLPNMAALPTKTFQHPDARLRLWFSDGVSPFARLLPDQPLGAVGYAMMAARVPAGSLDDSDLAPGAVTTVSLGDNSVTSAKIVDGTIVNADLSPSAAIADTKLAMIATVGKVANSATTATPANTPNAIVARDASGNFSAGTVTATFAGNGAALTDLNASQLRTGTVPDVRLAGNVARTNQVWLLDGNTGTTPGNQFLGTTDDQPLEFKVNGLRALRIEDNGDSSDIGTTPDGAPNFIAGSPANSVAAGVVGATISGGGATNWDGNARPNLVAANFATIGGGNYNAIQTDAYNSTIGGGVANTIQTNAHNATIGGGYVNTIQTRAYYSTVGGGFVNAIQTAANSATLGGGWGNTIQTYADSATLGGGWGNTIQFRAARATIGGGYVNTIQTNAESATIGGGIHNSIQPYASFATIGGGLYNTIQPSAVRATIGGGGDNTIQTAADYATIAGGRLNNIGTNSDYSAIGGGYVNTIQPNATHAIIGGGYANTIQTAADYATIGGGYANTIQPDAYYATIAGGRVNDIGTNSSYGAIGGGYDNNIAANAAYATIPGGQGNYATNYGFAAGYNARALHPGAFVWSDGGGTFTPSATNNSVTMRARNGFRFFTGNGAGGAQLEAGDTSWSVLSDRNVKKDFAPVDSVGILEKLAAMPITQWHYQWEASGVTPHIGPMAQDFKAAFYPGSDDKRITTQEADGVALAAIQGLNQKVEGEVSQLRAENAELKQAVAELKRIVQQFTK